LPQHSQQKSDKAADLEGAQDQGGKHGGQAGMPEPTPQPGSDAAEQGDIADASGQQRAKPRS
jgi:hypothetical protein